MHFCSFHFISFEFSSFYFPTYACMHDYMYGCLFVSLFVFYCWFFFFLFFKLQHTKVPTYMPPPPPPPPLLSFKPMFFLYLFVLKVVVIFYNKHLCLLIYMTLKISRNEMFWCTMLFQVHLKWCDIIDII